MDGNEVAALLGSVAIVSQNNKDINTVKKDYSYPQRIGPPVLEGRRLERIRKQCANQKIQDNDNE